MSVHYKKYICKFCKSENFNAGIKCNVCGKYQKDNAQNITRNKVIDILNRELDNFDQMIGKTIAKVIEDNRYMYDGIAITFTDNTWIVIRAELDSESCQCANAELTRGHRFNNKNDLQLVGMWEED